MRIADCIPLTGLVHSISIGHRIGRGPDGKTRVYKPWFARWTEGGKVRAVTLRTANKSVAIQRARDLDEQLNRGIGLPPKNLTVQELIDGYLMTKRSERRATSTIAKYKAVLDEFRDNLPAEIRASAPRLHSEHFDAHSVYLAETRKLGDHTWSDRLTIIKQMGRWAENKGKLIRNPFKSCIVPDPKPTDQPCLTPEEVAKVLAAATGQMHAIAVVLLHAGLRFGELRDLNWNRVDFVKKTITVDKGGSSGKPKDHDRRVLPMHATIEAALQYLPRGGERVFYQGVSDGYPDGDNPLDERRLLRSFKRLCERAGLENPKQFSLHSCRRTFASMLARSQVSYKYALEFMGHTESEMLDHYFKMFDNVAAEAIGSIQYPSAPPPPSIPDPGSKST